MLYAKILHPLRTRKNRSMDTTLAKALVGVRDILLYETGHRQGYANGRRYSVCTVSPPFGISDFYQHPWSCCCRRQRRNVRQGAPAYQNRVEERPFVLDMKRPRSRMLEIMTEVRRMSFMNFRDPRRRIPMSL